MQLPTGLEGIYISMVVLPLVIASANLGVAYRIRVYFRQADRDQRFTAVRWLTVLVILTGAVWGTAASPSLFAFGMGAAERVATLGSHPDPPYIKLFGDVLLENTLGNFSYLLPLFGLDVLMVMTAKPRRDSTLRAKEHQ